MAILAKLKETMYELMWIALTLFSLQETQCRIHVTPVHQFKSNYGFKLITWFYLLPVVQSGSRDTLKPTTGLFN